MKRVALAILALAALNLAGPAAAKPSELKGLVSSARPAGCADYRFLVFNLYRAELWSDARRLPGEEYALTLTYRSDFTREELVETSIEEMARISGRRESAFGAVRKQLNSVFRAVKPGDRFTAYRESAGRVRFYRNGRSTGALTREADLFMSIWLGPKTRFAGKRDVMLSGRCSA